MDRARYLARREKGLCSQCNAPALDGKASCDKHLRSMKAAEAKLRAQRKAAGVCLTCGSALAPSSTIRCERHLLAQRARKSEKCAICGDREHRAGDHKKLGLCGSCGRKASRQVGSHRVCEVCYEAWRKVLTERADKAGKAAVAEGKCYRCRKRPIAAGSRSRCRVCLAQAAASEAARQAVRRTKAMMEKGEGQ